MGGFHEEDPTCKCCRARACRDGLCRRLGGEGPRACAAVYLDGLLSRHQRWLDRRQRRIHHQPANSPAFGATPTALRRLRLTLLTHSYSGDGSAGTVGGQFGCQYQWGWFVLGGEWDANWSGLKEDNSFAYGPRPAGRLHLRAAERVDHKQLDWFSTARVRLGAAWWDRVLVYATGGLALGALNSSQRSRFSTGRRAFRSTSAPIARSASVGPSAAASSGRSPRIGPPRPSSSISTSARSTISRRAALSARRSADRRPHVEHQHRREGIRRARRHQLSLPSWSGRGSGCGPLLSSLSFVKTSNPGPRPGVFSCAEAVGPPRRERSGETRPFSLPCGHAAAFSREGDPGGAGSRAQHE